MVTDALETQEAMSSAATGVWCYFDMQMQINILPQYIDEMTITIHELVIWNKKQVSLRKLNFSIIPLSLLVIQEMFKAHKIVLIYSTYIVIKLEQGL